MPESGLNANGRLRASTEASPKQVIERQELCADLPKDTRIYLIDIANTDENQMICAARKTSDLGLIPVAHFAARRFPNRATFERRIQRLAEEAGVSEALVIAGDAECKGPFNSTIALLETGLFDVHGFTRIGVAGHPGGSPEIASDVLWSALKTKQKFAAGSDANFHIVTQFGFDPRGIATWLDKLEKSGNQFPVHVGIAGPAKLTTLLKYAEFTGIGNSIKFLRNRGNAIVSMLAGYDPESLAAPLEERKTKMPDCKLAQLHVFPFGGLNKTTTWLTQRGSWENTAAP